MTEIIDKEKYYAQTYFETDNFIILNKNRLDTEGYYRTLRNLIGAMVDDIEQEDIDWIIEKVIEKTNLQLNFIN